MSHSSVTVRRGRISFLLKSISAFALTIFFVLLPAAPGFAGVGIISLVTHDLSNDPADDDSFVGDISPDGRYICFNSYATDIVSGDTNGTWDVFLLDTQGSGTPVLISTGPNGIGDSYSESCSISDDGRYVAFMSDATNLVTGDTNGAPDIFIKDTQTGTIAKVSEDWQGAATDGDSFNPDISGDGRYVAFTSAATDILPGDTNGTYDVFWEDTQTHTTKVASSGGNNVSDHPAISGDGSYVAFDSYADNLVIGDSNSSSDVFRWKASDSTLQLVSYGNSTMGNGDSQLPSITSDGRYVVFESAANNWVTGDNNGSFDIFRRDITGGTLERVSNAVNQNLAASGPSSGASISADGRYIVYSSIGTDIVVGDTNGSVADIFFEDMLTATTRLISVDSTGTAANGGSANPLVSADGRFVIFQSAASNLVSGDTNSKQDVFITPTGRHYLFTWYDDLYSDNWVLMANPETYVTSAWFNLAVAGTPRVLPGSGQVSPGSSITPRYNGVMGGPVDVGSLTGTRAVVSQRTLWPKGGSSLEEVPGTDAQKLSNLFYWTWYDQLSPGYTNWVLVSNPNAFSVFCDISIAGTVEYSGIIQPGDNITQTFPDKMGGPVKVQAWTSSGRLIPAKVMASQRVLSNYGGAFNEVVGIPAAELHPDYLWTWYDNTSPGARNWVLIANPSASNMYYQIKIAGTVVCDDTDCSQDVDGGTPAGYIPPGGKITPRFNQQGGPVEVTTWSNPGHSSLLDSICSLRTTWGPSFEEVPGYPYADLLHDYQWTWYDQQSPGMTNWILVNNPTGTDTTYTIKIGGTAMPGYNNRSLPAGATEFPTFAGIMNGPVEVSSPGFVMTSQRVLYNGYFNEVLGTDVS